VSRVLLLALVAVLFLPVTAGAQIFRGDGLRSEPAPGAVAGGDEIPAMAPPGAAAPTVPAPAAPDESLVRSPGFTQDRQFTNARLWLLDTGQYTIEQWWTGSWGVPAQVVGPSNQQEQLLQTEVGFGLLPHLEVDLLANFDLNQGVNGNYQFSPTGLTGVGVETRIAIGSRWGQIWGNPVIDVELWGRVNEATRLEGRLLAGGEVFTPRLIGAVNLMFARNSFEDDTIGVDYEILGEGGLSYELVTDILHLGVEATLGNESHNAVNANLTSLLFLTAQVGPVILLTEPHKRFKLLAAVLYGLAYWDPPWQTQLVIGTTF